jgi:glutamyl-tRNA synthetase
MAVETLKARAKTLSDMAQAALFYFKDIEYDTEADAKFLTPDALEILENVLADLKGATVFDKEELEKIFSAFLETHQVKLRRVAQPLRVALTGRTFSPGIFEVMEVLGKETIIKRLSDAIFHIKAKKTS